MGRMINTPTEILTLLKTVDGDGSGLDADVLKSFRTRVLQHYFFEDATVRSTTVTTPIDNTPPNNSTETALWHSVSFTPRKTDSKILFRVVVQINSHSFGQGVVALFNGVSSTAVAAKYEERNYSGTHVFTMVVETVLPSWSGARTLQARFGRGSSGGFPIYLNASFRGIVDGSPTFGAATKSSFSILEIAANI